MPVDYDGAYEAVVQRRWSKTSRREREDAEYPSRQGQLVGEAPDAYALNDTLKYQRGHADVFRKVYETSSHVPPKAGQRLLVVDIGAGAATVAVALGETWGRKTRKRTDYLAFDPNPMMRRLGERLLRHLRPDFRSSAYLESLEEVDFGDVQRLLFTLSYLSHQDSVTPEDRLLWASLIERAVNEVDRAVELIYTTAALSGGALPILGRLLDQAGIKRKIQQVRVQVEQRFPDLSEPGRVHWNLTGRQWRVQAEHWTLRS